MNPLFIAAIVLLQAVHGTMDCFKDRCERPLQFCNTFEKRCSKCSDYEEKCYTKEGSHYDCRAYCEDLLRKLPTTPTTVPMTTSDQEKEIETWKIPAIVLASMLFLIALMVILCCCFITRKYTMTEYLRNWNLFRKKKTKDANTETMLLSIHPVDDKESPHLSVPPVDVSSLSHLKSMIAEDSIAHQKMQSPWMEETTTQKWADEQQTDSYMHESAV